MEYYVIIILQRLNFEVGIFSMHVSSQRTTVMLLYFHVTRYAHACINCLPCTMLCLVLVCKNKFSPTITHISATN